jgi:hypothetical protein
MASNIVPSNIDPLYPVAGRDNDSQGFRDNFQNIKTNFTHTETEINDLQSKVVLKTALTGTTLDNDMAGALFTSATIRDFRETQVSQTSTTGAIDINILSGPYHVISTTTGNISLSFSNFPTTGNHSKVRVEVNSGSTSHTITLPAAVSIGSVEGLSTNVITVPKTGTYLYEFSTHDGGASIMISDLLPTPNPTYRTPASSIGALGDHQGMLAFDANYIYTCTADYDGAANIWKRLASGATW